MAQPKQRHAEVAYSQQRRPIRLRVLVQRQPRTATQALDGVANEGCLIGVDDERERAAGVPGRVDDVHLDARPEIDALSIGEHGIGDHLIAAVIDQQRCPLIRLAPQAELPEGRQECIVRGRSRPETAHPGVIGLVNADRGVRRGDNAGVAPDMIEMTVRRQHQVDFPKGQPQDRQGRRDVRRGVPGNAGVDECGPASQDDVDGDETIADSPTNQADMRTDVLRWYHSVRYDTTRRIRETAPGHGGRVTERSNIADDLRDRLDRIPRVPLGSLPTPLQEAPRLADLLGVRRLFVKRDDLTGLGLGGNKVRTLEHTIAEALENGANLLVGAAYVHSNHCRQLAAAGARLGIEVRLMLRRADDRPVAWQGNLLLDELFGAEIEFVDAPDTFALLELARRRVEEMLASGRRPSLLTLTPGSKLLGAVAAMRTLIEIEGQVRGSGESRYGIYVSSGGPTYAGLLSAARVIGADTSIRGISHQFDTATQRSIVTELLVGIESRLGLSIPLVPPDVDIDDRFIGPGYGIPSEASLDAIRIAGRLDGLVLDPIYTGKAMAGLLAHAREGRLTGDDVIVFHHTGGVPSVFSHADSLRPHRDAGKP